MQVRYQIGGTTHSMDTGAAEDLSAMCRSIEDHVRQHHPELSERPYLIEKVADGLLNALAVDATEVELGDLSR